MKKIPFIFCILFAAAFAENFNTNYVGDNRFQISTDISVIPSISSPSLTYCTGTQITLSASISSNWKHSALSGTSLSVLNNNPGVFNGRASTDHVLPFISPASYEDNIGGRNINDIPNWNAFVQMASNQGAQVNLYDEALSYIQPSYDCSNDQRKCNAQVAAICKAPISLVEYNAQGNAIRTTALTDYAGSGNGNINLAGHNQIASGNQPATRYFRLMLDKTCATIVKHQGFYDIYKEGHHSPVYSSAQPLTITVQNPYACNLPSSNPQVSSPVAPRATVSANFTLSNPARNNIPSRNLTISGIEPSQNSPFSNFQIISPRPPFDLAPGSSVRINTTSTAPQNAGNYPLNIVITYATKEADCSASAVQCSAPTQLSAQVVVQQNRQYSCTLAPASATITNNARYPFVATCRNSQGAEENCPILDWRTNAGALSSAQTPAQQNPQQKPSSTLTVNNPQGNFVRANGTVDNNPFSCDATLRAETVSCTLSPANARIINNSAYRFTASCINSAGAATDCPILDWRTNAGALSNPQTQQQRSPSSTLTVTNPQGNSVAANGTFNNVRLSCDASLTPETLTCTLSPALIQIAQDGTYRFNAACADSQDAPYSCPPLAWASNAGSMSPQQHNTSSVLTVTSERGTHADATGSFNGIAFSCQSRLTAAPHTMRCELSPSSARILRGNNYTFSASCFDLRNDDRPVNCPLLNWESAAGGMSPAQTPAQRQAQPRPNSTLQVTSIYGTYALAQGTSEGSDFSCNATLSPEPLSCEISPVTANIQQGGAYLFNMSCFDSAGAQALCPQAAWNSPAGRMVPQISNTSSVLNVTDATGTYVRARRPAPQAFSCNSTLTNFGIGYTLNLVAGLSTNKLNPAKGEDFTITATVRNPGGDASDFTNTLNISGGFVDSRTFDVQSLSRLDSLMQQFQFTCPNTPTILNFVFKADSGNAILETNERDNTASISVLCGPVLTCMDYV